MTKVEILYKLIPDKLPPNTTSISEVLTPKILLAMEEYSKQQILSFLKWMYDDEIIFDHSYVRGQAVGWVYRNGEEVTKTFEELYYLFLKETEK